MENNKLVHEKSPYLLQHAYNPVNWYPWSEEAFDLAKKENKPIFLSIGYSTCHWCHVMEHESFEDKEVAKLLNEGFISIKVDREERPELDNIYMTVCQMMTRRGGWPLTIIMTPEKKPFFAGTYFSKYSKYNRPGMLDLLPNITSLWKERKNDLEDSANEITEQLNNISIVSQGVELTKDILDVAYKNLLTRFDEKYGGFGERPKFPTTHNLLFLLRCWKRTGERDALEMVEKTLESMRFGGIYDHIGFGFHRYSTDNQWLVPHFEKMLYDQAMISMAHIESYQVTKKEEYKKTAYEIFEYILRDMTSPLGGFYSAEDADSEGVEGKFYVWSEEEIKKILTKDEAELVIDIFNMKKEGNYLEESSMEKIGNNILHIKEKRTGDLELLETARKKLFYVREKRIHPHKDDKILTDWNGLMIVALAKAGSVFGELKYVEAAKKAFNFTQKYLMVNGKLLHRFRDGEAKIHANLDDYAFLIWGLIELYETTFEFTYLKCAIDLNNILINDFWDEGSGGYFFTSSSTEDVIVRKKEIYDGAIPSGNSVALINLHKLYHLTQNQELKEYAVKLECAFSESIKKSPIDYTMFLCGIDFNLGPVYEVIISGDPEKKDTKEMVQSLKNKFIPNKVLVLDNIREMINGKATAYICSDFTCKNPITDISEMMKLLSI